MDLLPPRQEEVQDKIRDGKRSQRERIEQESTGDYLLSSRSSSRGRILCPPVNRIRHVPELEGRSVPRHPPPPLGHDVQGLPPRPAQPAASTAPPVQNELRYAGDRQSESPPTLS